MGKHFFNKKMTFEKIVSGKNLCFSPPNLLRTEEKRRRGDKEFFANDVLKHMRCSAHGQESILEFLTKFVSR